MEYRIGFYDGNDNEIFNELETIEAASDYDANAYAEANYSEYEWWVMRPDGTHPNVW